MLFIFNELRTATAAATSDKLGEILLREGLITQDQLKKALLEQKNTGMRLGYTLVKLGYVEETEISKMLARQYRMPAVDLSRFEVDPKILKLLPPDVAVKHTVLPLKREGRTLTVAIADPNNVTAIEDIKFITRCDVFPVIAGEYTLRNAIEKYYQQSGAAAVTAQGHRGGRGSRGHRRGSRRGRQGAGPGGRRAGREADQRPAYRRGEARGVGHSHRAVRARDACALPRGRLAARGDEAADQDARGADVAYQDHGAAQHRGAARAAGRPHQAQVRRQSDRLPRLDAAGVVRREDRAAYSRQGEPDARPDEVRVRGQGRAGPDAGDPKPVRHGAGHGPDRVGQDHDAVFGAVAHQPDRREHHDRRGSRRVQPDGHQSGAGAQRRGHDVRGRAQGLPAPGPEHHHGGRDPRSRDRVDRHQGGVDRPPGAVHAAHERRALHGDAYGGHGHRAVQRGERRELDRGAAAGPAYLLGV